MQDSASFWTDIKNLEERLSSSPDSFCFARLSEVYLKVGMIDDALHVARQGVKKHPRFLSGQKALSLACHSKGLNDEALAALKLVTEALPEDVPSQKLLGRLYAEMGNQEAAILAFRIAQEFDPDDMECRIELESFERSAGVTGFAFESDEDEDDEEIIEDLEILEEFDIPEESHPESSDFSQETPTESHVMAEPHHDPLSTVTLAELYVTQGFIHKALEIYRAIQSESPDDRVIAERVAELEVLEASASASESEIGDMFDEEAGEEHAPGIPIETSFQGTVPEVLPESVGGPVLESQQTFVTVSGNESTSPVVPDKGVADNALATLDGWLERIRRIKSCR
jgi:tetratricopeptide (TPR) repeat protein